MCLAIPGKVLGWQCAEELLAQVDFGGIRRPISLALVPEAGPGDWVIVHAGFALAQLDAEEAAACLAAHAELEQKS